MSENKNLHKAKKEKNDEFYTQISDIEKEVWHYKDHFKNKVVFCNCDDPRQSNFWKFFAMNFEKLELKKLISTHFEKDGNSYKLEIVHDVTGDGKRDDDDTIKTVLKGDGDFRSDECIAILKEADIVVTNPPFSLFREYIELLVNHNKKFLVIGNNNAITYKEIFRLIKENKLWLGYSSNKTMEFCLSDDYTKYNRVDEKTGKKYGKVPAISWFTNLPTKKRQEEIILFKKYNKEEYPKYDNYDAIEVSKVKNIPCDYDGVMGVPITFLDKFNPEQFEILGLSQRGCHDSVPDIKKYNDYWEVQPNGQATGASGNKTNENPNLKGNDGKKNYFINKKGDVVQSAYQRIFIKTKRK